MQTTLAELTQVIGDLYVQVLKLKARIVELEQQLSELQKTTQSG